MIQFEGAFWQVGSRVDDTYPFLQTMTEGYRKMNKKDRAEMALLDMAEAIKQGFEGPAWDNVLEASPSWGFELGDFSIPMRGMQQRRYLPARF